MRLEDSLIIGLFFERKEQAIEELDSKYGHAVKKTVSNILTNRQEAEECVNDTYLGCWNYYLTVFFDGDQEGAPMYIQLHQFPGYVSLMVGTGHAVG